MVKYLRVFYFFIGWETLKIVHVIAVLRKNIISMSSEKCLIVGGFF